MRKLLTISCLALSLLSATTSAFSLPRDAYAVLNRCGKPLKGDETIYENTVAGGRRILRYERGTLNFDRQANDGWSFTYGEHKDGTKLGADEMANFMPCLRDALADSASAAQIPTVTSINRVETSMRRQLGAVILGGLGFIALMGLIFFVMSRRRLTETD